MNSSSFWETFLWWNGFFDRNEWKRVWLARPLCVLWLIWKARNNFVFRNEIVYTKVKSFFFLYISSLAGDQKVWWMVL